MDCYAYHKISYFYFIYWVILPTRIYLASKNGPFKWKNWAFLVKKCAIKQPGASKMLRRFSRGQQFHNKGKQNKTSPVLVQKLGY